MLCHLKCVDRIKSMDATDSRSICVWCSYRSASRANDSGCASQMHEKNNAKLLFFFRDI